MPPVTPRIACVASVSVGSGAKKLQREKRAGFRGFRGKELQREKRAGRGRGRKEDKPLDFENRPLCLSCLTDFMLSSSIQVAF